MKAVLRFGTYAICKTNLWNKFFKNLQKVNKLDFLGKKVIQFYVKKIILFLRKDVVLFIRNHILKIIANYDLKNRRKFIVRVNK